MSTTAKRTAAAKVAEHTNAGHSVMVLGGVVTCTDCHTELDASGARPGLVEANQFR